MYEKEYSIMTLPEVKIVMVTPEMAKKWISENKFKNRNISWETVKRYSTDMKNGDWDVFSYEPLSVNENGYFINGNHRLNAIVRAGVTIPMFIAYGVSEKASIYDRGRGRSTKDTLDMKGIHVRKEVISTTKWVFRNLFNIQKPTDSQVEKYVKRYQEELEDSVQIVGSKRKRENGGNSAKTNRAVTHASCYIALRCGVDAQTLKGFYEVMNTGFQSERWETSAIVARNYLINYGSRDRGTDPSICNVILRAISDYNQKISRKRAYDPDKNIPYIKEMINADSNEIEKIKGMTGGEQNG